MHFSHTKAQLSFRCIFFYIHTAYSDFYSPQSIRCVGNYTFLSHYTPANLEILSVSVLWAIVLYCRLLLRTCYTVIRFLLVRRKSMGQKDECEVAFYSSKTIYFVCQQHKASATIQFCYKHHLIRYSYRHSVWDYIDNFGITLDEIFPKNILQYVDLMQVNFHTIGSKKYVGS